MITAKQLLEWERAAAMTPRSYQERCDKERELERAVPLLIAEVRRLQAEYETDESGDPQAGIHVVPADPMPPMHVTVEGMRGRVVDMEVRRESRLRRPTAMRLAANFDEAPQSWLDGLVITGKSVAIDIDCNGYPGKTTGVPTSADGATVSFICELIEWLASDT